MAENDFRGNIELIVSNLQMLLTLETVIMAGALVIVMIVIKLHLCFRTYT